MFLKRMLICLLCSTALFISMTLAEGNSKSNQQHEVAKMRSIQTPQGPMVEITVGKFVCITPYLTVKQKQKADRLIRPVKDNIEIKGGKFTTSAKLIEISLSAKQPSWPTGN